VAQPAMHRALVRVLNEFYDADDAVDMREKGDALLAGTWRNVSQTASLGYPHLLAGFRDFVPLTHDPPPFAGRGTRNEPW